MDRDGPDVVLAKALPKGRQLARWLGAPFPGRRVVGEDLHRLGTDLVGTVDRLDHAGREGQVGTDPGAMGEHVAHRTMTRGVAGATAA